MDAHGDRVDAGAHEPGHVELVGKAGTTSHTHPLAVDPHAGLTFDAIEAQRNNAALPLARKFEGAPVVADRVIVRREGRINREREVDVRIGGKPVGALALQNPVAGHSDSVRVVTD